PRLAHPDPPQPEAGPDDLIAKFRSLFGDGIVFETETLGGAEDMRTLDATVLAGIIPATLAGLDSGESIVATSGRWLTAQYRQGALRRIFVLPPDPGSAALKAWREVLRQHG
ncbi:MAG: hypothetical protein KIH64_004660, partial [Mycobacterium sp.]|nr:hypothetical protein [Mycobacterium sp.]